MSKTAVCFLTIRPDSIMLDFLSRFNEYVVFIVVDDLINDHQNLYPNVQLIKVTDEECRQFGYIHSSYMPYSSLVFNEIIAWDRALCYFTNINKDFKHVWFFEDDVFFYNEQTLISIDSKYPEIADILCKDKNPQPKPGEWDWFWPAVHIHFPEPYFHSPICAVRLSHIFLDKLNEYIQKNKKLAFIEALLPSIAHYYDLNYVLVDEFSQIHWRKEWDLTEMNKHQIFHPMKNREQQKNVRHFLEMDY